MQCLLTKQIPTWELKLRFDNQTSTENYNMPILNSSKILKGRNLKYWENTENTSLEKMGAVTFHYY